MTDRNPHVEGPLPNISLIPTPAASPQFEEGMLEEWRDAAQYVRPMLRPGFDAEKSRRLHGLVRDTRKRTPPYTFDE